MSEWEELLDEYRERVLHTKIQHAVRDLVGQVARRFNPHIYGNSAQWDDAALDDIAQSFVLKVLLEERQLAYVMDVATDLPSFRALVRRQIHRFLIGQRRRTVIDNLLDRIRDGDHDVDLSVNDRGDVRIYAPRPTEPYVDPDDDAYRRCASKVALVPKARQRVLERAPVVYQRESLNLVVQILCAELPRGWTLTDAGRVLEMALTGWLLGRLGQDEEVLSVQDTSLDAESQSLAREAAEAILNALDEEGRNLLAMKMLNTSDTDAAHLLGVSRPTYYARLKKVAAIVSQRLDELSQAVQEEVLLNILPSRLVLDEGGNSSE